MGMAEEEATYKAFGVSAKQKVYKVWDTMYIMYPSQIPLKRAIHPLDVSSCFPLMCRKRWMMEENAMKETNTTKVVNTIQKPTSIYDYSDGDIILREMIFGYGNNSSPIRAYRW